MPLKSSVQEAHKEEKKWNKSHNVSNILYLSSKILAFVSCHTIQIKVRQAILQSVLPLVEFPKAI